MEEPGAAGCVGNLPADVLLHIFGHMRVLADLPALALTVKAFRTALYGGSLPPSASISWTARLPKLQAALAAESPLARHITQLKVRSVGPPAEAVDLGLVATVMPRLHSLHAINVQFKLGEAWATAQQGDMSDPADDEAAEAVGGGEKGGTADCTAVAGAAQPPQLPPAFHDLADLRLNKCPLHDSRDSKDPALRAPADIPACLRALLPSVTSLHLERSCPGWTFEALLPRLQKLQLTAAHAHELEGRRRPIPFLDLSIQFLGPFPRPDVSATLSQLQHLGIELHPYWAEGHIWLPPNLRRLSLVCLDADHYGYDSIDYYERWFELDTSAHPGLVVDFDGLYRLFNKAKGKEALSRFYPHIPPEVREGSYDGPEYDTEYDDGGRAAGTYDYEDGDGDYGNDDDGPHDDGEVPVSEVEDSEYEGEESDE